METMDIQAAIQRLNQSSDAMAAMGKILESQPKGETDFLKRESIVARRALIETALNTSTIAAILIYDQMMFELPLLMGHSEDFLTLVKAQARYRAESSKACSILQKTAPVNQPAPADSQAPEPETLEDRQERINKRFEELMAKTSPIVASTAVPASTTDDNAGDMPNEAPADATPIIVEGNIDQSTERSD